MKNLLKITKAKVDAIPLTKSGQVLYWDSVNLGFGLRVGSKAKSFIVQKKIKGRSVRVTVGLYGQITSEQARREAVKILGEMAKGNNPVDEKRHSRAMQVTLGEAFEGYLEVRKDLKPKSRYDYSYAMRTCFSDWKKKALVGITKDMVGKRHSKIGEERGKAMANLAFTLLQAVFNFSMSKYEDSKGRPIISINPVSRLSDTKAWNKLKKRDSYIPVDKLPDFFEAIEALKVGAINSKDETVADYLLFLLFTGLRRREAESLKWENVNLATKTIKILDTKNNEPLTLPLSDHLVKLLQRRSEVKESDYVFFGASKAGHLVEPKRQVQQVRGKAGLHFTIHDLRRTFITIAESLDISYYALKRLINHGMSGDVTAGYVMKDVERLRKPMQTITDHILKCAGRKPKAKVVNLRSGQSAG